MRALLQCLQTIHAASVVHRDLKPGNFLFNKQTNDARLVDFGMARYQDAESRPPTSVWKYEMTVHIGNCFCWVRAVYATLSAAIDTSGAVSSRRHVPSSAGVENRTFWYRGLQGAWEFAAKWIISSVRTHDVLVSRFCWSWLSAGGCSWDSDTSTDRHPSTDVWSAGVILLSFLTQHENLFAHPDGDKLDDALALEEMAFVFGSDAIRSLGRTLSTSYVAQVGSNVILMCSPSVALYARLSRPRNKICVRPAWSNWSRTYCATIATRTLGWWSSQPAGTVVDSWPKESTNCRDRFMSSVFCLKPRPSQSTSTRGDILRENDCLAPSCVYFRKLDTCFMCTLLRAAKKIQNQSQY